MKPLTYRQRGILEALVTYIDLNHYAPSFRELGKIVGLKSSSTIHVHLENLAKSGYIEWEASKPRTIRLVPQGVEAS
ncbi:MAG: transcriptional regulator [Gorillibacterium sp.]|nr:transcriptional regulator [Gorillibacterium sp.]